MSTLVLWICLAFEGALALAWVTAAPTMGQSHAARVERTRADMRSIGNALDLYQVDCGRYPDSFTSLWLRPAAASRWKGPYLKEYPPKDPWGNDYQYVRDADGSYEVSSHGADGARGCACPDADLSSRTTDDRW